MVADEFLEDFKAVGEPAHKLVDALVEFNNKVALCGKVSGDVHIFFGANLTALSKPDNGIKPIAATIYYQI